MEVDPFHDEGFYSMEKVRCLSLFRRLVRQVDMYALPITLRYKSEKMFYTNFGAFTSIFIILSMMGLFVNEIIVMFARTQVTQSTTTILNVNKDPILEERGGLFLFGYRFLDENGEVFSDKTVL